jgi:putative transposase
VEKAHHTVTILCRCLRVTPSGFYAWLRRPESARAREDRRLKILVRASFDGSRRNYGSPRVHEDLIEQQVRVSRKRVVRLMQEEGLKARVRKRYKHTTISDHDQPIADNLLKQTFTAAHPNQRWVGDTTEFVIGTSGKLYLAAILDLFSRFVVHQSTGDGAEAALPESRPLASLRSGLHVRQRGLPGDPRRQRHRL